MGDGLMTYWGMGWVDQSNDIHTLSCVKQTESGELLCNTGSPAGRCAMTGRGGRRWEGGAKGIRTDNHV